MQRIRIIPCLLLKNAGLVKTVQFKDPKYIGDPINAVHIFNEKEVDELIFLDINASREKKKPQINLIKKIASECFMPLGVGGGIKSLEEIKKLFNVGIEKVIINTHAIENPELITKASKIFGSQSIVVSIDVKRNWLGNYDVYIYGGTKKTKFNAMEVSKKMENAGAGELFINSIDRDGTMNGFDINLVRLISDSVEIPVIACGGAGKNEDLGEVVKKGHASAVAAGSLFVYHGKRRAVLINFPTEDELKKVLR